MNNSTASGWAECMQALSHYSYHVSSGQFVLCDLQGGIYEGGIVLTDPVVHSRDRVFGVTDLGDQGISTFFSSHTCNRFCKSAWTKPRDQRQYYHPSSGTAMEMQKVVTRPNAFRPELTAIHDDDDEE